MKRQSIFHSVFSRLCAFVFALGFLFITSSVKAEETQEMPDNGIPVVYVNIDESQGTIEDMLADPNHNVYCYGTVSITVPEGFHYSDFPDLECVSLENLSMSIRGRGNTTWDSKTDKKPFKIKLDKKTDVFGLGKNKHWVLVANHYDESLLRDRITAWLGDRLGFEFTPRGVPVDFVMTGEEYGTHYLGSYYFSENVRVDDNRLEIDELEEDDVEEPAITGGYLLQNSLQVREGSPDRFITSRGTKWATHTPSFDTEEEASFGGPNEDDEEMEETFTYPELEDAYENSVQQTYIQNHIQKIEDALFEEGQDYKELVDIESAAKYWLVNEFALNGDAYATGSTYIYKKRDVDGVTGKLYWGPLWDFDFAWDSGFNVTGMLPEHEWMKPMFTDHDENGFVEEVKKQWSLMREALGELIEEGGVIDQYYEETNASASRDYEIYHPGREADYKASVEKLKDWIRRRLEWFDANISMADSLVHKIRFIVNDELYDIQYITDGTAIGGLDRHPEQDGYVFMGWYDENGEKVTSDAAERDMTLTAKYIPDSEATFAQDIVFRKNSDVMKLSYYGRYYRIAYRIIPEDADEKSVVWTSEDESFASVDEEGMIRFDGAGRAVITATLKNGKSKTFTLTILEDDPAYPEEIVPESDVMYMNIGNLAALTIDTVPSPAHIDQYSYEAEDENIVSVDDFGVIRALGPGETYVHVATKTQGDNWDEFIELETVVKVIVSEEKPQPAEIVYTVIDGEKLSVKKGAEKDITFTIKRNEADETCYSHFKGVMIDGRELKKDIDYTATSGSTVITLKAAALKTLKEGKHEIKVLFDDGDAKTELEILSADQPASPDTSDQRNTALPYITAASLLVFLMALTARFRFGRQ